MKVREFTKVRELTIAAMFVALIALGAFLSLPIGLVSITFQTLFVMLAGLILSRRSAVLTVFTYLLLGLIGLPIFSGGTGGLTILAKPSIGFLLGFFPLVLFSSFAQEKSLKQRVFYLLLGNVVLYFFGFAYMYYYFRFLVEKPMAMIQILQIGVLPYLPGDIVKIALAVFLSQIWERLNPKRSR